MTEEETRAQIGAYKQLLAQTDYKALKHSEGALSDGKYEPTRRRRAEWRAAINELEKSLTEE